MDYRARAVAHDLDLDVARILDEALDEERPIAEGRSCLLRGALEARVDIRLRPGDEHAAPAAAGARLDQHRIADRSGEPSGGQRRRDLIGAGDDGHARLAREGTGCELVAEPLDGLSPRSHERDPLSLAQPRESRGLGEESVTRMKAVASGRLRGMDHEVGVEIAVARRRRAEHDCAVRELRSQAVAVGVGDSHHGLEPERLAGADDAHGDLAPIGHEDARERHHAGSAVSASGLTRNSGAPNSTISPSSTQALAIRPLTPARTGVNSFITSIRHTSVASAMVWPTST